MKSPTHEGLADIVRGKEEAEEEKEEEEKEEKAWQT